MGMKLGLAALALQSASASAPPSDVLQPSSRWNIEYADKMCILQRRFGSGANGAMLAFKPAPFSELMQLVILLPKSDKQDTSGSAQVRFDDGRVVDMPFIAANIRDSRVLFLDAMREELKPVMADAKVLSVHAGTAKLKFAMTMAGLGMKALQACERDLLIDWGMDEKILDSVVSLPKTQRPAKSYVSFSDYPGDAMSRREQGMSGVRFWVGTDGRVSDCQVVESSGSATLDKKTCEIVVQRFRFKPAMTRDGAAVRSLSFFRLRWEIGYK